jgi:single-stranded DNA-binding protein
MINRVLVAGRVTDSGTKLYYSEQAKPELRLTLMLESEQGYKTFIPVYAYGDRAERMAELLNAGETILVDGALAWKSALKKDGSKVGLVVTAWSVAVLKPSPTAAE